ncbi:hypothetical protein [Parvularcula lutaonensis]|uniref:Uncharacterized protein n=1 Tax=Parvularcula lutaonensis TaxID=491923 RepID=A0ABV7M791_9PROT|nr:hypothetical protein [Parvularcula lutaonensis]GGY41262.1 hypothetical protein GCM10007148_07310 [Parvularcula lutaonensis]
MTTPGRASLIAGGIVLALLAAGVVTKLGIEGGDGAARLVTLSAFGLLLAVLGNLVPKIAPPADGASDLRQRSAGRTLFLTGLAVLATALIAPPGAALAAGSALGLLGLAFAGGTIFLSRSRKDHTTMSEKPSPISRAILLLFVGLGGAFGLIILDRLFGDQVAQWSAVVWVLILGFVAAATTTGLLGRR